MIVFGLLNSVFDILTFLSLRLGFHASATPSRSGWFIESTITELAVMLVLRTNRPLLPKPPRPCCHPSPSPPSRSRCLTARWPLPSRSTSLVGRLLQQGMPEEQAPALPLQQPRPNQFIRGRLGGRLIGLGCASPRSGAG
jgi:hypothetical protein